MANTKVTLNQRQIEDVFGGFNHCTCINRTEVITIFKAIDEYNKNPVPTGIGMVWRACEASVIAFAVYFVARAF